MAFPCLLKKLQGDIICYNIILSETFICYCYLRYFKTLNSCENPASLCKKNHPVFASWVGKVRSLVLYLLHVSFTTHTEHFASDTFGHQMCSFPPNLAVLYDISWVSYNLTKFWHYLPGDSVWSHRLRAQSHKTAPTPFRCQLQV